MKGIKIWNDFWQQRREKFRNAFNLVQVHPYIQWMYPKSLDDLKSDPEFPVKVNKYVAIVVCVECKIKQVLINAVEF